MKITNRVFLIIAIATFSAGRADNLLNEDLIEQQQFLRESRTIEELLDLEKQELAKLTKAESDSPREAITLSQAQNLLDSISPHPVVGNAAYNSYNRKGTEIGYCFGRATYVHLALLKMGVKKDAIKKIWTVGLTGGQVNWIYHVATAVRTTDGNWTVIDNFVGRLISTQDWATQMRTMTIDGKKATFITDAKKFAPKLGTYSRVQLGLDLNRETDFYKNYFGDLFKWLSSAESHKYFTSYGIVKANGEPLKLPARIRLQTEKQAPPKSLIKRAADAICRPITFSNIFQR